MKHLMYLLIMIFFLILSCSENEVDSNDKIATAQKSTEKPIPFDPNEQTKGEGFRETNYSLRTSNRNDKNRQHLKVIIDGEIYYKKNSSDVRVGDSDFFRTNNNRAEYNIKTGKYNHNYQIPHGGKVLLDKVK